MSATPGPTSPSSHPAAQDAALTQDLTRVENAIDKATSVDAQIDNQQLP